MPKVPISSLVLCTVLAAACASPGGKDGGVPPEDGRIHVVTTVSPITNLVQNVGGSDVIVTGLVPEGTNSHTFEPAPSDAAVIEDADVMFVNGLHLEEPTMELARANLRDDVPLVELGSRTITPDEYIYDFSFPEAGGAPNPHLWTNPAYAKRYAEIIKDELSRLDPAKEADFAANYGALVGQLDEIDVAVREVTETVPPEYRKLLTYHDSFPYFAREYGWEIIGAVQPADLAEPTAQEVAELIDQVRSTGVPAIFGSEVFPSPVLEQIADETGARYVDDLRDDDLPGEAGAPEHSLAGLLLFDYSTFMEALGGDASAFERIDPSNVVETEDAVYRS
ncbi:MAG: metal ABC transporter substrate-binding protein [Actinomycetota bacterium]